jgi:hypothetical protein
MLAECDVPDLDWKLGSILEGVMAKRSTTVHQFTDHQITDLKTFQAVTTDPKEPKDIAALYFYQQLDCLIELAYKVSCDFFTRPHLYINLGQVQQGGAARPLRAVLAQLHARLGYDEALPSKIQRSQIFKAIFGSGGAFATSEEGDFPRLRDGLINAAAAFSERVFDTGETMLRERVRTTVRVFTQYLKGLQGDSITWSRENALSGLTENVAYAILRSRGVASVFGIDVPPVADWPYKEDANGDKLVEAISRQLATPDEPDMSSITREHILNLQRAALRGAEAIATVLEVRENATVDASNALITHCYTWGAALLDVTPAVSASSLSAVAPASTPTAPGQTSTLPTARNRAYGLHRSMR